MSSDISYLDSRINFYRNMFVCIENIFEAHKTENSIPLPELIEKVARQINDNSSDMAKFIKEIDPMIRRYIKYHPVFETTRGANGGARRRRSKKNIEQNKAKEEIMAAIDTALKNNKSANDNSDDMDLENEIV